MTAKRMCLLLMSCLLMWLGSSSAQETKVEFKDLPPAVQGAAKAQNQGATMRGYFKEIENGKTEYEVQLLADGKKRGVSFDRIAQSSKLSRRSHSTLSL